MINITQWAEGILASKKCPSLPVMTHPGIELLGKSVKDAVCDGQIHAQAIKALSDKYPADGCTVIMDLTVEAEAFGATVSFPEEEVPNVTKRLVSTRAEIDALQVPSLDAARVPTYLQANRLSAELIPDKPIFAGCIGPFSLAGRLYDISEMMMALYLEPESMEILLQKCTDFILSYCKAIKATGVHGVVMAEPAAGLISNADCIKFSTDYVKQIIEAVQDENFMVILHNCGNGGHSTDAMIKSGAKGLHFGNKIDMIAALKECPQDILVMGNLDPVGLFQQSNAEEVYQQTSALLEAASEWDNFVISTGCDVPPAIPFENIESFYKAVADYNQTR